VTVLLARLRAAGRQERLKALHMRWQRPSRQRRPVILDGIDERHALETGRDESVADSDAVERRRVRPRPASIRIQRSADEVPPRTLASRPAPMRALRGRTLPGRRLRRRRVRHKRQGRLHRETPKAPFQLSKQVAYPIAAARDRPVLAGSGYFLALRELHRLGDDKKDVRPHACHCFGFYGEYVVSWFNRHQ
jgi:hypothetical protein